MNELQIRLTADIKDLQSAINKAKATLKSFESETATDSEKSNVGFRRKIGLIEQLTAKAKALKVSLSQATNEKQIAGFNAQLEQTNQELARLNALGKSFSAPAVKSFDNLKRSAGAASGAAISFGRIIQDAPFGIIGVANNLQNFGEQFVALGDKSTTAAGKLKLFFSALITPSNLAILAVSALTAAWQAYSLGVFDSLFATESLSKKLKELSDNTKSATANASTELTKIESLKKIIEDETVSRDKRLKAVNRLIELYPQLFSLADKEKLLNGQLVKSYEILTKAIIAKAKASIAEQELPELVKQKEIVDSTLKSKEALLEVEKERLKTASRLTPIDQAFSGSDYEQIQRRIKPLTADVKELSLRQKELDINIKGYTQSISSFTSEYQDLLDPLKDIKESSEGLNRVFDQNILFLQRFGNEADNNKKKIEGLGESLATSLQQTQKNLFNSIAALKQNPTAGFNAALIQIYTKELEKIDSLIGSIASKRQSSPEFKVDESQLIGLELPTKQAPGLVQEFEDEIARLQQLIKVTTDPKLIDDYKEQLSIAQSGLSALLDKNILKVEDLAQAFTGLGSVIGRAFNNPQLGTFLGQFAQFVAKVVAGSFAVAKANAVAGATQSSLFTGPAAAFTLPAFIASSVGLVASAFAALGNFGGGGGGGSTSGGSGSTFTNRREFGGPVSKGRAYIVGERRPELFVPNTNGVILPQLPSMDYSGASIAAGAMAIDVNIQGVSYGDDILFTVQQAQIRRNIR
jgi:hypothetical protein